jgi:predicted nucleotidyltransferase component of viral defense system
LQEARKRLGTPWEILERDYLLSWVLVGVARVDVLRDSVVLKGGTALRKGYFGEYRFSEDLDFTGTTGVPAGTAMAEAVQDACETAVGLLDAYAPVEITCERYTEREPHPGGQEAFAIRARLPWQRRAQTRVMVEVTMNEKLLRPAVLRPVIHDYGEPLDENVRVYALEEIVAEKLRAILQHAAKLDERGWSRSRARDYYDLWRVLGTYGNEMHLSDFQTFLREKCSVRDVSFQGPDDFFPAGVLGEVERTWDQWLGPLVPNLPPYEIVIEELRPQIMTLLG